MKEFAITGDWIDRYNDQELGEPERSYFQQQMNNNPLLRAEVFIDSKLNTFLQDEEMLELMGRINTVALKAGKHRFLVKWLRLAAAILCLAAIGAAVYLIGRKPESAPVLSGQRTILPLKKPVHENPLDERVVENGPLTNPLSLDKDGILREPLLADNFKPMAELELLAGSVTRAAPFRLVLPSANVTALKGLPVDFRWTPGNTRLPVNLVLLNNHGIVVFDTSCISGNEYRMETAVFPQGLYYWKIIYDDELVFMGKLTLFYVFRSP
ncbi:MAG: hypothetical protein WCK34_02040 [Bacteroidota bacterium]